MIRFGVTPRPRHVGPAHNRREPPEDVSVAHAAGESVLGIANRLGVSRGLVVRWLREKGAEPRSRKDAGKLRVVLTDGQRIANRRAAVRNYRASKSGAELPPHLDHGSPAAIAIYGCKCAACRTSKREYDRVRREAKSDELAEHARRYRLDNLEALRAYGRENYRRNAEAIKGRVREYQKTEKGRLVKRAVGDRRRGVPLTSEGREFAAIIINDPCAYCGESGGTVDHIQAVAAGGDGDWLNLTGACASCNSRKRAMPLLHFLLRLQENSGTGTQPHLS